MQSPTLTKVEKGVMILPLDPDEANLSDHMIEVNPRFLHLLTLKTKEGHSEEDALQHIWKEVHSFIIENEHYKEKSFQKDLKTKFGVCNLTFIITDIAIWNRLLSDIKIKVTKLQAAEQEKSAAKIEKKTKPSTTDSVLFVSLPEEEPVIDLTNSYETLEDEYYSMVGHFDKDIHEISQEGSKKDVMNFLLGFRDGLNKNDKMNETKYYTKGYIKGVQVTISSDYDNGDDDFDWVATCDN
jgi:hypothetical protein